MSYTEKVAGLESHQFVRDDYRFNVSRKQHSSALPRQPRVGSNSRNSSDSVFTFANAHDFKQGVPY